MWYVVLFVFVLLADQVTKLLSAYFAMGVDGATLPLWKIIDGFLEVTYVENTSGMMGLFNDLPYKDMIFLIATAVILLIMFIYLGVSKDRSKWRNFTMALILSGAIGNFIDRILHYSQGGYVRDMIHVIIEIGGVEWFPYVFNVADIALVIGAFMLVLDLLFIDKDAIFRFNKPKEQVAETSQDGLVESQESSTESQDGATQNQEAPTKAPAQEIIVTVSQDGANATAKTDKGEN